MQVDIIGIKGLQAGNEVWEVILVSQGNPNEDWACSLVGPLDILETGDVIIFPQDIIYKLPKGSRPLGKVDYKVMLDPGIDEGPLFHLRHAVDVIIAP